MSELKAIEDLQANESWLVRIEETVLKGLLFAVEFEIYVNGETLPFILKYSSHFPDVPPAVFPRESRRYSQHQYGAGGEMCLEYRSDNWDSDMTGAMLIVSTYRLLSGERPSPDDRAVVPDVHHTSLGQQLRGSDFRFLMTAECRAYLSEMEPGTCTSAMAVTMSKTNKTWTAYLTAIGPQDKPDWIEPAIPSSPIKPQPAVVIRVSAVDDLTISNYEHVEELIRESGGTELLNANCHESGYAIVVADTQAARMCLTLQSDGEWKICWFRTVQLQAERPRLFAIHEALSTKKVGIVGAGSLGSKIAVTLARSGVTSFVLVDDDILKPGNLVRHELDVRALGAHKVDGVAERLMAVSREINFRVRRVQLGGQEASASTSSAVDELAECDLIIDATGDANAINFAAAAARTAKKPMLWAEVYAGGIGGFVCRVRPEIEPPPHTARREYVAWCHEQGAKWVGDDGGYESQTGDEPPLIANDADVSVIAGHASRMVLDTLMRPEVSDFPHPAYVIGLARGWIFDEPFDVRPVDFASGVAWEAEIPQGEIDKAFEHVVSILERKSNAN